VPDGSTHYHYFKKGYYWVIPSSLVLISLEWRFGLGNLLGYSLHRYIDNDLDLMGVNSAEGRQVNELPIIGHVLFGLSSIYGSIFRKWHRHWITHFPGISTIIRLVVIFILPFMVLDGYGVNFIGGGWWKFWLGIWIGLSQADAIHWFLDKNYED
jgi:hypothetical protein